MMAVGRGLITALNDAQGIESHSAMGDSDHGANGKGQRKQDRQRQENGR